MWDLVEAIGLALVCSAFTAAIAIVVGSDFALPAGLLGGGGALVTVANLRGR